MQLNTLAQIGWNQRSVGRLLFHANDTCYNAFASLMPQRDGLDGQSPLDHQACNHQRSLNQASLEHPPVVNQADILLTLSVSHCCAQGTLQN